MTLEKNQVISAQALLRSASLKVLDADTVITSENIGDYAPTLEDVAKVSKVLIDMGFDVAELLRRFLRPSSYKRKMAESR